VSHTTRYIHEAWAYYMLRAAVLIKDIVFVVLFNLLCSKKNKKRN